MANFYKYWNLRRVVSLIGLFTLLFVAGPLFSQGINFRASGLQNLEVIQPTSLEFGPDGRLYVAQQDGVIWALRIEREDAAAGAGTYTVTQAEKIELIRTSTPNHNDDGSAYGALKRQITGIVTAGTSLNPVVIVSSSDSRIGGSGGGTDTNLDTNSGVISELTWNGENWEKVELVRGLPRAEENHSSNGMDIFQKGGRTYLLLQQGGHTNKGAPSNNFAGTPEYFLSGAVLVMDLTSLHSMPAYDDPVNKVKYVYDLPTLNDPERADIDNTHVEFPYPPGHPLYNSIIDIGDPFGGNNGLNQAFAEDGGPVQIFSPGYRNGYDIVITEEGRIYTSDNGPNQGWGGVPLIYDANDSYKGYQGEPGLIYNPDAGDYVTNGYNQSASNTLGDALVYIGTIDDENNYFYGGHPNPSRAFPEKAGIMIYEQVNGKWELTGNLKLSELLADVSGYFNSSFSINDFPDDPRQGEYSYADEANPNVLDIKGSSTNGICVYTASNFDGVMQGNLLTASFNGDINRYTLSATGDAVESEEQTFQGFGSTPLDVIAQGDEDIFPGTVWSATYGANAITIFEPGDAVTGCLQPGDEGYDGTADYDFDGYTNDDEKANGTNICSGGSSPSDNNKNGISDLWDEDDDDDGVEDIFDAFALDSNNGMDTNLPVFYPFWNNDPGTGLFGLGFTGLMLNPTPTNYLDQYEEPNLSFGGAAGKATVDFVDEGDAVGNVNSQNNGFQFGVNVDSNSGPFNVHTRLESPFFSIEGNQTDPLQEQSYGIFIGNGDQDNYLKVVLMEGTAAGDGLNGIEILVEDNAVPEKQVYDVADITTNNAVDLYISINPQANTAQVYISLDGGITQQVVGSSVNLPISFLDPTDAKGMAVGFISTSVGAGPAFGATWDFINVTESKLNTLSTEIDTLNFGTRINSIGKIALELEVLNDGGPDYGTISIDSSAISGPDQASFAMESGPQKIGPGTKGTFSVSFTSGSALGYKDATLEIFHDGENSPLLVPLSAMVQQLLEEVPLLRINAGGDAVSSTDGGPQWRANSKSGQTVSTAFSFNIGNILNTVPVFSERHASIPNYIDEKTYNGIFAQERWDPSSTPEMKLSIPASDGNYKVRLYMSESYEFFVTPNSRIFHVKIEEDTVAENIDLVQKFGFRKGGMLEFETSVADGKLDIEWLHKVQNPLVNAIEIFAGEFGEIVVDSIVNQQDSPGDVVDFAVVARGGSVAENFEYTISGQPDGISIEPSNGQIFGKINLTALSGGAAHDGIHRVVVTADKPGSEAVSVQFDWQITEKNFPLLRINAGGPQVTSTDYGPDWEAAGTDDTSENFSFNTGNSITANLSYANRHSSIPAYIDAETFDQIFGSERYDTSNDPEMEATIPLNNGIYSVRLYMGDGYGGTNAPGKRVFDIFLEGKSLASNVDLVANYGFGKGSMLEFEVEVLDKELNISWAHRTQNPLINAIEIYGSKELFIEPVENQENIPGDEISLAVTASGGDKNQNFVYSITGQPDGVEIDSLSGEISGIILETALSGGPMIDGVHNVVVSAEKAGSDPVIAEFEWEVSRKEFPILRINAGGPLVISTDNGPDWQANSGGATNLDFIFNTGNSISSSLNYNNKHSSVPEYIDEATFNELFHYERYDPGSEPEMEVAIPLGNGKYTVRLFMGDSYGGTNDPGRRVFDILMEGKLLSDNIDLTAHYGFGKAVMLEYVVEVADEMLNISWGHEVQNPLINAIEIYGREAVSINAIAEQKNNPGDQVSLQALATGGNQDIAFKYSISGQPDGITIDSITGEISGIVEEAAMSGGELADGVHSVTVTAEKADSEPVSTEFEWIIRNELLPVLRVNAGGPLVTATDGGPNWQANTSTSASQEFSFNTGNPYPARLTYESRHTSIPEYIDETTFSQIFGHERYDSGASPEMELNVPLSNGSYFVRLYIGDGNKSTNSIGRRVFNILMEGKVVADSMDLALEFGPGKGAMLEYEVEVLDEELTIAWGHVIQNPIINAVEVYATQALTIAPIAEQQNAPGDQVSLALAANGGNNSDLVYSMVGQPDGINIDPATGVISGVIAESSINGGDNADGIHSVTVSVEKPGVNAVSTEFDWIVAYETITVLRINAGGTLVVASDEGPDWQANNSGAVSTDFFFNTGNPYSTNFSYANRHSSIPEYIDQSTFNAIFANERWDGGANPEMEVAIPLPNGIYTVRLFMGDANRSTNTPGRRVFDVLLEDSVMVENLDLVRDFGSGKGAMIEFETEVTDGTLNISWAHEVQNPLINAIEILTIDKPNPLILDAIADRQNDPGDIIALEVAASGGNSNYYLYSMKGQPDGIQIDTLTGKISGFIDYTSRNLGSNQEVVVSLIDKSSQEEDTLSISFNWNITNVVNTNDWTDRQENESYTPRHECSFVQAGDKFYLMGGRENPGTIDVYDYSSNSWEALVDSAPVEFNHFQATEYKGLIWIIGAFKDNHFPRESPAEFIWAFDPAARVWIQGPEIPLNRQRGSAGLVVYKDKFYVVGGNTVGHNGGAVAWFDEYDPATGTWTPMLDAPHVRDHFHAVMIGNELYVAGGRLSGGTGGTFKPLVAEVDVYDFNSATWRTLSGAKNLPTPRAGCTSVNYRDKLLVIGGEVEAEIIDGQAVSDALKITEEYDPVRQTWKRLPNMNYKRHGTQAVVSGDAIFILAGSYELGGGSQRNMENYGEDNPQGLPSIGSNLVVPDTVTIEPSTTETIQMEVSGGNVGIFVSSIEISGSNAGNFRILSEEYSNVLIHPDSLRTISVEHLGALEGDTATVVINYGFGEQQFIQLQSSAEAKSVLDESEILKAGEPVVMGTMEVSEQELAVASISPNPASGYFNVNYFSEDDVLETILIYNMSGRMIRSFRANEVKDDNAYKVPIDYISPGTYIVRLLDTQGVEIQKLLIIK
ncbi:malectin domain-containing carbohydrate-binding protein [Zunongwangia sp. F260]|uniref:Malectin domain-containing carbohydrate-binding protein n=1 Tax=Autumnicola lenta TaxID=3075593 RepID=A0ABU3CIU8_9FLAO|nr:malectin domain-containing carbohydrate-binding protein [Zunongwangia sp. F260]MDT0646275.1 malectin domain-containing carbohydrate-binding protein [Zunongwangia sp. F260]